MRKFLSLIDDLQPLPTQALPAKLAAARLEKATDSSLDIRNKMNG